MNARMAIAAVMVAALGAAVPAQAGEWNILKNPSFEDGLTDWNVGNVQETDGTHTASGECRYNAVVAPGTDPINFLDGFAATDGTHDVLGYVTNTNGTSVQLANTCVLYQDFLVPDGALTATYSFDLGMKDGQDQNAGVSAGLFPSTSVPGLVGTLAPNYLYAAPGEATLTTRSSNGTIDLSTLVGETTRFAIQSGAVFSGFELVGIDNVKLMVTGPCPAGMIEPAAGGTECQLCQPGQFSELTASTECSTCTAGTYSAAGATGCTTCIAGTASAAGAASCTTCLAGTASAAGAATCSTCPAGTFSADGAGTCTPCPGGSVSAAGASACTTCAAGTFAAAGAGTCAACPADTYSSAAAGECLACATGTSSEPGSATCTQTPAGGGGGGGGCATGPTSGASWLALLALLAVTALRRRQRAR